MSNKSPSNLLPLFNQEKENNYMSSLLFSKSISTIKNQPLQTQPNSNKQSAIYSKRNSQIRKSFAPHIAIN